jgi:hypothetical protein
MVAHPTGTTTAVTTRPTKTQRSTVLGFVAFPQKQRGAACQSAYDVRSNLLNMYHCAFFAYSVAKLTSNNDKYDNRDCSAGTQTLNATETRL